MTSLAQPMHVAFCVDDNFCQHLAALVVTLQQHCHRPIQAHLLSSGLNEDNLAALRSMTTASFSWSFYTIGPQQCADLPISLQFGNRINQTTYYRILLADLLPKEITKVLYLDADIITLADIAPLFDTEIEGVAIAAVADGILSQQQRWLALSVEQPHYFNAGVLLMNLARWRENNLTEQVFSILNEGLDWKYNDQDVLNLALNNSVKLVDTKWNTQSFHFRQNPSAQPHIVHFTESEKPWHISSSHPFQTRYLEARELSPYSNFSLQYYLDNFDQQLMSLVKETVVGNAKVVIYGAGVKGRRIFHALKRDMPNVLVVAFIDKHERNAYQNVQVNFAVPEQAFDYIVLCSNAFQQEIVEQLRDWQIPQSKIIRQITHPIDKALAGLGQ